MAFAAVTSLLHTIKRLQIPPSIYDQRKLWLPWARSALKGLDERSSRSVDRSVINELDAKIREVVWKLEDSLESYALRLISQSHGPGIEMKLEVDSLLSTLWTLEEEYERELQKPSSGTGTGAEDDAAAVLPSHNESTTVGLSDLSQLITKELLGWQSELTTVSLVGMAGIGKTHLATLIYHHPLIDQHFHSRLWVRVGPKDQTNNILVDILAQIESHEPRDVLRGKSERTLRSLLQNSLRTRRYLIVLDDIWSTQVLDYFTELLPDYGNRSRFLLTTRLQQVAQYYPRAKIHQMPFLNNKESWNLLWLNVFAQHSSFPSQLEKPGRRIAEKCEGLPLLILAVANILRGFDITEEYWKKVAEKKTTTFTDAYDQIYKVLLSSYEYLPQYLKPCFLYMGVFPQSCEILLSKLFNLWAAEDFLEPSLYQKVEDYAMVCLEGLVSNSLSIVCKRSFTGIKSSKLHSAYWHLCVVEARKNKFFHVLNKLADVSDEKHRRLAVQNNILFGINGVCDSMAATISTTRSLLFTGEDHQYPVRVCLNMMLLMKVLDALAIRFYEFPEEVLNLLQLRYLALTHNGELPSSINKLKQLEWLNLHRHHNIILLRNSTCLPKEIWEMHELRHVRIMGSNLPDPSNGAELPKLLTLHVNADSCTEDVFRGIPNLNKLGIKVELEPDAGAETLKCLAHIGVLKRLKSLKCVIVNPRLRSQVVAPPDHLSNLPRGLKKLSLDGLGYSWNCISSIDSLENLQVLKLRCSAFQGAKWGTEALQFQKLEYLLLEDIDLVHWTAQDSYKCFPSLRCLILRHCYKLKRIPPQIGEIKTLERMEVDECSPSVVASAQQIKKKRGSLQLAINSSWNI